MKTFPSKTAAFSLIEVTMALSVTTYALVAIFGMLLVGVKSNQTSVNQTVASGILSTVAADLRATRLQTSTEATAGTGVASTRFSIPIPSEPVRTSTQFSLTRAGKIADTNNPPDYLVTVTFLPNPASPGARAAILAQLQISWPAVVTSANTIGSAQTFVALDRN